MTRTLHETVTVQTGGLIQLRFPDVPEGSRADVSVQIEEPLPERQHQIATNKPFVPTAPPPKSEPLAYSVDPDQLLIPQLAETAPSSVSAEHEGGSSRARVVRSLENNELDSVESRVALILQNYLDTRDDDIALLLRYYEVHQADVLEGWDRRSLDVLYSLDSVVTIVRYRQKIQNDYGMFMATLGTQRRRKERAAAFYRYSLAKSDADAEIRIYLDETRGDPGTRYAGVAGVCIIDWRQYESSYLGLRNWRENTGWDFTLHASPQAADDIEKHLALLNEVKKRRGGLLFVGHDIATRALSSHTIVDLFVQMTLGCLEHMKRDNCLGERRAVVLIKEADDGFDRAYKNELETELQQQMAHDFPDTAYLKEVRPVAKGHEVLLEVADMVAFGMQRRAMYSGWSPRDKLAEAVANVTGFENEKAMGVVYRAWY